ncbi:MAG: hypothetical protein LBN26_03770 [Christensenellaceae bacterium]|jgi:hypothetical protein|nr:hypothetical protein [Christensenellaceae bacterium]
MKKIIALALALMLALSLAACGGNSNNGGGSSTPPATSDNNTTPPASQGGNETTPSNNGGSAEWPADDEFAKQVPKPNGIILQAWPQSDRVVVKMDWTADEARAYGAELEAAGVTKLSEMEDEEYGYSFQGEINEYTVRVDLITGKALKEDEQPHYQILVYKLS